MPFFENDEVNFYYQTFNWDKENITPFVLVHGFSYPGLIFDPFIAAFSANYPEFSRFVYFDVRGHGKTTTKAPLADISEKVHVKDIVDLIEFLKIDKFYLLGVSMGGRLSEFVAIHFGDRVKKLIISTPIPTTTGPILPGFPTLTDGILFVKNLTLGSFESWAEGMKGLMGGTHSANFFLWAEAYYKSSRITYDLHADVLATFYSKSSGPLTDEQLAKIKSPILITTGDKDFFFDHLVVDFRRKWGGPVSFHAFTEGSHFHVLEHPIQFADVVGRFLKK